jgi:hypothetical protein
MIRLTSMENMEDIMDGVDGNRCSLPPENSHRDKFNDAIKWLKTVCYDAKSMDAIDILIAAARENPYGRNYADEANRIIAENNERIAELEYMLIMDGVAELESMLTVKGEPGEAIERMHYGLSVIEETHPDTAKAMSEFLSLLESTILALTEQVGVRDAAMRWLAVELSNSIDLNEHYAAKMEDLNTPRPATMWSKKPMGGSAPMSPHGKKRIEELIKAALDAAKEGKNDGSN